MKKVNGNIVLKDFEGNPITTSEGEGDKELRVKDVLLRYLNQANIMGVTSDQDKLSAYAAGLAVATGGDNILLEQEQYDIVKRLVDSNKIRSQGQEQEIYNLVVQMQVKKIVDDAETIAD